MAHADSVMNARGKAKAPQRLRKRSDCDQNVRTCSAEFQKTVIEV
jgi:hypothetical protein